MKTDGNVILLPNKQGKYIFLSNIGYTKTFKLPNRASGQPMCKEIETYSSDAGTTDTAVFSVGNEGS